jgi:hypothetical protein
MSIFQSTPSPFQSKPVRRNQEDDDEDEGAGTDDADDEEEYLEVARPATDYSARRDLPSIENRPTTNSRAGYSPERDSSRSLRSDPSRNPPTQSSSVNKHNIPELGR